MDADEPEPISEANLGTPHDGPSWRRLDIRARAREASSFVASLLDLPRLSGADRRVAFRQVVAELARSATDEGPSPLEGIRPEALVKGVGAALEAGLADDLDWLDQGAAGSALYQLAAALPVGPEQREVGRRVLARLLAAKSDAFALMATQMARAGGKGLLTPAVFARVALLVELPIGLDIRDATLAGAIASRRNLTREYVIGPSTRSLPERRLASRILERAARDALGRALLGDRSAMRIVGPSGALEPVWLRLLGDREPLVWRHVAIARGLLSPYLPEGIAGLENDLSAKLSPTEWRRAAAALGGLAASKPEIAVRVAQRALRDGLLTRDPGAIAPYMWGLARAAESEPEVARELFDLAKGGSPEDVADAVLTLERELGDGPFIEHARERALAMMGGSRRSERMDDGAVALRAELQRCLEGSSHDESLGVQVDAAIRAFAEEGAKTAHERGLALLDAAKGVVDALMAIDDDGSAESSSAMARRTSFVVVRDLDMGLLERDALVNLLRLDTREARVKSSEQTVEGLRDRVFVWLVDRELAKVGSIPQEAPQLVLHLARLKAMLHLLDGESLGRGDDTEAAALARLRRGARSFEDCFAQKPPSTLRRALMATFARCLDALARSGACDISDVVLVASSVLPATKDLQTLAEASMDPDTRGLFSKLAAIAAPGAAIAAFEPFAEELAKVGTARSDGLRAVIMKLHSALSSIGEAGGLRDLLVSGTDGDVALVLENACFGLAQVHAGARARVFDAETDDAPRAASRALSTLVGHSLGAGALVTKEELESAMPSVVSGVPAAFATIVQASVGRVAEIPREAVDHTERKEVGATAAELPAWVPPRRSVGAFYLERPLAAGGAGSVFVVTRVEDKHDPEAERFALKVPDYNANAARHLSEAEFLALFRSEASALMALPQHTNLAHFVTFDLASRPKPILVMELVEGPNLERLIDTRTLDMQRAQSVLSDVCAGLEAMHDVEVGHLDLKPANVVLRAGTTGVLVDFGLAGRKLRLGCGSAPYSAPEVWGHVPKGSQATPMAVDVYAFACLAFESFTGHLLFDGDTEVAMVSQHMGHDGLPPKLRAFAQDPRFLPVAEILFAALRRDPGARIGIRELRKELSKAAERFTELPWPLPLKL